ncbi:glycosyltransferase family 2 protein [Streptosporangium sp. NBC_01756]|uniref:glycosyltransferase family 2 protein n=1 Tax=Streptosporangium sp. NBC_01756 TaxID=2975950 RepID=UPI002DD8A765|nr:glycosyltransferase family 2 protein [Streptosporangium sp. NBC_01756]WSC88430.1 glycosyltransferase [Streptosporangium sp. NBC_01756]
MKSSVVICVYTEERWEDIRAAVESVENQRRRPYEIILVVDYNTDLHLRLKQEYPGVTVVENTNEKGLSGGKNTGAATASGDIVAYLDDDAVAEPGWLEALEEGFQDPTIVGVGGQTRPLWATGRRPRWFPHEFDWTVGCTYRGMPTVRTPIRNVMGGNAAFRREAVGAVGGFHTGIGRSVQGRKSRPLGCEETEFCIRLSQSRPGAVMLFEPDAVIGHKVSAQRAGFAYFRSRCYAEGLSKALVASSVGTDDGLSSERAYAMKALPLGALRGVGEALRGDLPGLGRAAAIVIGLAWTTWGYLVGTARLKLGRS